MGKRCRTAVIGLGLMGGSMAYALSSAASGAFHVVGYDISAEVMDAAVGQGAVHDGADSLADAVKDADLCIFCTSPEVIVENMQECLHLMKPGAVLTDICGVKSDILGYLKENLPPGLDYVGLHPMAGKEVGGFSNADPAIFKGAGFIIVLPPWQYKDSTVECITRLAYDAGAGRVVVNSADDHDRIIAYTSDLMHISATALCLSYPDDMTMAHTAGAFRDCTRVAKIDPALWTELLMENRAHTIPVLAEYMAHLDEFKAALEAGDRQRLFTLLHSADGNKKTILGL